MKTARFAFYAPLASVAGLATLATTTNVAAQTPPPPPPPPPAFPSDAPSTEQPAPAQGQPGQPAPGQGTPAPAPGQPYPDPYGQPAPAQPAPQPGQQQPQGPQLDPYGWDAEASGQVSADPTGLSAEGDATMAGAPTPEEEDNEYAKWRRMQSLHEYNSLRASTGLMRVRQATSGEQGTFRFALLGGFYSGSGFLCTASTPCPDPVTGESQGEDDVDRIEAGVTISATPWPFLEAFVGFYNTATSNSNGTPQLLQVLGDANFGIKAFLPPEPDNIFLFGGEGELLLLNGTGGVGLDGGGTSFAVRALGTLDLNNRKKPSDRIPMRAHLNVGYLFDNSANVVDDLESTPPPEGRGEPIQRIERFGLGISRVDALEIGLGTEYIHEYVRPFAEWTIDIPVNRQGYVCNIQDAESRGDLCLGDNQRLGTTPSRLTLGARVYPWQGTGLGLTAAADIGTTGTSEFLEETTPELPYNLWFGVAWAADTNPPPPVIQKVEVEKEVTQAEPRRFVVGQVVDAKSGTAIPDALLRYQGRAITGMVAGEDGTFRSSDLAPGSYTFDVYAEGYKDGVCMVTVPESAAPTDQVGPATPVTDPWAAEQPAAPAPDATAAPTAGAPAAGIAPAPAVLQANGNIEVPLTCQLEELPRVATINGAIVDAESGQAVQGSSAKVTDKLGRELELATDEAGAFQFRNVPFGSAKVTATAPGYMTTVVSFDIDKRDDLQARITLNKRPEQPNVVVTPREVKLKTQVHFNHDSADILPDSMAIIEEIAEVLKEHQELARIEIQGHTDNTGPADYNRNLSQERAEAVKSSLEALGVEPGRLVAKGYGPDKPLVPNVSDANRARNRRVQLIVIERN